MRKPHRGRLVSTDNLLLAKMVGSPLRLAALVTAGLLALLVATGGGGNGALRAARLRGATTSPGAAKNLASPRPTTDRDGGGSSPSSYTG